MRSTVALALLATTFVTGAYSQSKRRLVTEPIDEARLHRLTGNTRVEAVAANDAGLAADTLLLEHMQLLLKRSPEQQAAADLAVKQLHDKNSPSYHQWMSATEFGNRFGAAPEDIAAVQTWLESQGFKVNTVYPNGLMIDFSGNAGQVRKAFRTEIHHLKVNGGAHLANMSDPRIPAALAGVVRGVVSMHDFRPHAMKRESAKAALPEFTYGSGSSVTHAVTPGDLATIYNVNPLFAAGITGKGQTIAVVEDTDLYATSDWDTFRKKFGLNIYTSGSLATVHPGNCADPGVATKKSAANYGDDGEGVLLGGVADGQPAARAGMKKDDRIVELAGKPVKNIEAYMEILMAQKKGDTIDVVILRAGQKVNFKIKLE